MNESLASSCREFEQFILAGIFRSAGVGRTLSNDEAEDSGDSFATPHESDAAVALFSQALSGAVERAGGFGLAKNLAAALRKARS